MTRSASSATVVIKLSVSLATETKSTGFIGFHGDAIKTIRFHGEQLKASRPQLI